MVAPTREFGWAGVKLPTSDDRQNFDPCGTSKRAPIGKTNSHWQTTPRPEKIYGLTSWNMAAGASSSFFSVAGYYFRREFLHIPLLKASISRILMGAAGRRQLMSRDPSLKKSLDLRPAGR